MTTKTKAVGEYRQNNHAPPLPTIMAYLQSGHTMQEIATTFRCNPRTISRKLKAHGIDLIALRAFKERRGDLLAHTQMRLLEAVTDEKIKNTSVRDIFGAFNIAHNAERLERGQSTNNMSLATMLSTLEDLEAAEKKLMEKLEAKKPVDNKPPTE